MSVHQEEFEQLVARYERRIYNVAVKLTSSQEDAADLTQETFLRAFRAWGRFRRESQEYTWLYRILINLNKDRIGREARRREREVSLPGVMSGDVSSDSIGELPDSGESPAEFAERGELRGILTSAIESLPAGYKECVVLKDMEGLSYEQIAETMGITVEAVRSRLARARQQLRQRLSPYLKA